MRKVCSNNISCVTREAGDVMHFLFISATLLTGESKAEWKKIAFQNVECIKT